MKHKSNGMKIDFVWMCSTMRSPWMQASLSTYLTIKLNYLSPIANFIATIYHNLLVSTTIHYNWMPYHHHQHRINNVQHRENWILRLICFYVCSGWQIFKWIAFNWIILEQKPHFILKTCSNKKLTNYTDIWEEAKAG